MEVSKQYYADHSLPYQSNSMLALADVSDRPKCRPLLLNRRVLIPDLINKIANVFIFSKQFET
jgi:hypothetical protein